MMWSPPSFVDLYASSRLFRWLVNRPWWPRPYWECRVCGRSLDIAPDWPYHGTCPEHCPEHDYEYDRDVRAVQCRHCGEPQPYDLRGG